MKKPKQYCPPAQDIKNRAVRDIINSLPSRTDPNGSYTGRPLNPAEIPTQDADDL